MTAALARLLDSRRTLVVASLCSFALGLIFIFVWSPLPWGWEGIDHYHDQAIRLASGLPFETTDVPWGYGYFLAAFYVVFGIHAWVPLVAQVALNATVPFLLYRLVAPLGGTRVATLAALLTGALSFNTIYASTQSTDSVATVLFLIGLVYLSEGRQHGRIGAFVMAGIVGGLVSQFRPNLLLFPPLAAAAYLIERPRSTRKLTQVAVYLGIAGLVLSPWVVRNYRLMHVFLPTSTHGGVQLWYGTLQTGEYLESRADNPRKEFQGGSFDYTSIVNQPLIAIARAPICRASEASTFTLNYWTDRDATVRQAAAESKTEDGIHFVIPQQPEPTAVHYFFEAAWPWSTAPVQTPPGGRERPFTYFVSRDHVGDLDTHDDQLDLFDLVRMLRDLAWQEKAPRGLQDLDGDGRVTDQDVRRAVRLMAEAMGEQPSADLVRAIEPRADAVRLVLTDDSWLEVPRAWQQRATDLGLQGRLAGVLIHGHLPRGDVGGRIGNTERCGLVESIGLNAVFYRRELHDMQRYTALAVDNITRDPGAYLISAGYRAVRLFVINGSDETQRTQQFANSSLVYTTGTVASTIYFVMFLAGAAWAWKFRPGLRPLLLPIVYIPVTICFVLTNMRYTITVQSLMFVFVAAAIVAALRLDASGRDASARR